MQLEMAKGIVEAGGADEDIEFEIREDYSGREMYGKETAAIVSPDYATFIQAVAAYAFVLGDPVEGNVRYEDYYALQNFLREMRWDNVGRQIIIY